MTDEELDFLITRKRGARDNMLVLADSFQRNADERRRSAREMGLEIAELERTRARRKGLPEPFP